MALYIWLSPYFSFVSLGSGGGQYRGGFFLLNINDFWVMILSILNPFALVVASDVFFSKNLRAISHWLWRWFGSVFCAAGQQSCTLL